MRVLLSLSLLLASGVTENADLVIVWIDIDGQLNFQLKPVIYEMKNSGTYMRMA